MAFFSNDRGRNSKIESVPNKQIADDKAMLKALDICYDKALKGLPMSGSVHKLAASYMKKSQDPKEAAKKLCSAQIMKCCTSGFVTGLGGAFTWPAAIPANVGSVIYMQLRMIAAIAEIGGYDPSEDAVQTLAYVCLTGSAGLDLLKKTGIKLGQKLSLSIIKKIPGKALTKINQKVGFRLITKLGEKGIIGPMSIL